MKERVREREREKKKRECIRKVSCLLWEKTKKLLRRPLKKDCFFLLKKVLENDVKRLKNVKLAY